MRSTLATTLIALGVTSVLSLLPPIAQNSFPRDKFKLPTLHTTLGSSKHSPTLTASISKHPNYRGIKIAPAPATPIAHRGNSAPTKIARLTEHINTDEDEYFPDHESDLHGPPSPLAYLTLLRTLTLPLLLTSTATLQTLSLTLSSSPAPAHLARTCSAIAHTSTLIISKTLALALALARGISNWVHTHKFRVRLMRAYRKQLRHASTYSSSSSSSSALLASDALQWAALDDHDDLTPNPKPNANLNLNSNLNVNPVPVVTQEDETIRLALARKRVAEMLTVMQQSRLGFWVELGVWVFIYMSYLCILPYLATT